jgi:ribosomal protein S28E/S33
MVGKGRLLKRTYGGPVNETDMAEAMLYFLEFGRTGKNQIYID